jgi:hypothetical protein
MFVAEWFKRINRAALPPQGQWIVATTASLPLMCVLVPFKPYRL